MANFPLRRLPTQASTAGSCAQLAIPLLLAVALLPDAGLCAREGGGQDHSQDQDVHNKSLAVTSFGHLHLQRSKHPTNHQELHLKPRPEGASSLTSLEEPPPPEESKQEAAPTESSAEAAPTKEEHLKLVRIKFAAIGFAVGAFLGIMVLYMRGQKAHVPREHPGASPAVEGDTPAPATANPELPEDATPEDKIKYFNKKKRKILMDQAMSKSKLENLIAAILKAEAELKQLSPPTDEEIAKRTQETLEATDLMAEQKLVSLVAYLAPAAMKQDKISELFNHRTAKVQEKARELVYQESIGMCEDLAKVFDVEEVKKEMFEQIGSIELSSTTLVASFLAPAQLKLLLVNSMGSTLQGFIFFITSIGCLAFDHLRNHDICDSEGWLEFYTHTPIFYWYAIDAAVNGLILLVRLWVIITVNRALQELDAPPNIEKLKDKPVQALKALLDYYMTSGIDALNRYNIIVTSCMYNLANTTIIFMTFWMVFGCDLMLNTEWPHCEITALFILRLRCLVFLVLLIPNMVPVVQFFVDRFMMSKGFRDSIFYTAHMADTKVLGIGIPLVSIITNAWLVRSQGIEMLKLEIRMNEVRVIQNKLKIEDLKTELYELGKEEKIYQDKVDQYRKQMEEEQKMTDQQVIDIQNKEREAILDRAEQIYEKVSKEAKEASIEAEKQVSQWAHGEGPELLHAMTKGAGLKTLQEQLTTNVGEIYQYGMETASALQESESFQQATAAASQAILDAANDENVKAVLEKARSQGEAAMTQAQDQGQAALEQAQLQADAASSEAKDQGQASDAAAPVSVDAQPKLDMTDEASVAAASVSVDAQPKAVPADESKHAE